MIRKWKIVGMVLVFMTTVAGSLVVKLFFGNSLEVFVFCISMYFLAAVVVAGISLISDCDVSAKKTEIERQGVDDGDELG